jgi:predicted transcriptional regulator of viral defense system
MQLSKLESQAFDLLRGNNLSVFTSSDLSRLMNTKPADTHNLTKALRAKDAIGSVKRGVFYLKGTNEFLIGSSINWPSYLSFRSALNYYGFTDQMPRTIYFASTGYHKPVGDFRFVTLSKKRFFGYVGSAGFAIADKEKAIIDSLLLPRHSGGMKQVSTALSEALAGLNKKRLVDYALRMDSKAVIRRLGFLLEENGARAPRILRGAIGAGFERLDPSQGAKNDYNKTWLLDINW